MDTKLCTLAPVDAGAFSYSLAMNHAFELHLIRKPDSPEIRTVCFLSAMRMHHSVTSIIKQLMHICQQHIARKGHFICGLI